MQSAKVFSLVGSGEKQDKDNWSLVSQHPSGDDPESAGQVVVEQVQVPGQVHVALMQAGLLKQGDFFYRFNDTHYRWICKRDWIYTRRFSLPLNVHFKKALLVFHGLDTAAEIVLNQHTLARTDNMFVKYKMDVTTHLLQQSHQENHLQVRFKNMVEYAKQQHDAYPYEVPDDFTPVTNGERYRNYVRKEQCSFSWDWGCCFLPCGIWKEVELVLLPANSVYISDMTADVSYHQDKDGRWNIRVQAWLHTADAVTVHARLSLQKSLEHHVIRAHQEVVELKEAGEIVITMELQLPALSVDRWWPHGYGKQPLYNVNLELLDPHSSTIALKTRRIAFRTVELVQTPYKDGQEGSSFYFCVNGERIFCKGANFIPIDPFESRVTPDVIDDLLESCVEAHMNMLRIWGGGIYQQDYFYDRCDELGLMVWQGIPVTLVMVRQEVDHQVKRLMHHPSIVLWSGNNENQEALVTAWYEPVKKNPYIYIVDYHRLYHETIMPAVYALDKTRAFISSSPSNGTVTTEPYTERYKVEHPRLYGDTHYYNYRDDGTDPAHFPQCRFASEYGFQSMPWFLKELKKLTAHEDWHPFSAFLIGRNHHTNGQPEIYNHLCMHFQMPSCPERNPEKKPIPAWSEPAFHAYCVLTQVVHAMYLRAQTEHYRRLQGTRFDCMGALYWQCNDFWPAPSWAGLSADGGWKLAHSAVVEAFTPVLLTAFVDADMRTISVFLNNDLQFSIRGTVQVDGWNCATSERVHTELFPNISVDRLHAKQVLTCPPPSNADSIDLYVVTYAFQGSETSQMEQQVRHIVLNAKKWKDVELDSRAPMVSIKLVDADKAKLSPFHPCGRAKEELFLEVQSSVLTPWFCLELTEKVHGRFFPNGIHLLPGEKTYVSYRPSLRTKFQKGGSIPDLLQHTRIHTLYSLQTALQSTV